MLQKEIQNKKGLNKYLCQEIRGNKFVPTIRLGKTRGSEPGVDAGDINKKRIAEYIKTS